MSIFTQTMSTAGSAPQGARPDETAPARRRPVSAWILYGASVVVGLVVALSFLLTVLMGRGPWSVAIAAAVALAGGLALSVGGAPGLRRRTVATLIAGCGAGLMAGGIELAAIALMIALT